MIYAKIENSEVVTRSPADAGFDLAATLAAGFSPFERGQDGSWTIDGVAVVVAPIYATMVEGAIASRNASWDGFDLPSTLHAGFGPFAVPDASWLSVVDDVIVAGTGPAPEPVAVPPVVTMRQARIALSRTGLLSQVDAALASLAGQEGEEARIEWEFSMVVERHRPLVQLLAPALGLTDQQLDELFILADTL
ncbi:MAG: hypothetical protein CVV05_15505 [Gammaproteobacteria bacterium HGW-Gammaproteobacteria-1]|jgi:hypothetical protein|nr:MAG: hypothetical protein CVV05_15505 [Gammaproteobacteria bacterium HGW-Gammaproteobacteria-1]